MVIVSLETGLYRYCPDDGTLMVEYLGRLVCLAGKHKHWPEDCIAVAEPPCIEIRPQGGGSS